MTGSSQPTPVRVAASLMCADLTRLGEEVKALEEAGVDLLHVDAADGHFVPNLLLGPDTVAAIRPLTRLPIEVHLMVSQPRSLLTAFVQAGSNVIIFHAEAAEAPKEVAQMIHAAGAAAGLALNPRTPVKRLSPVLSELDQITFMTVDPGFAGQSFQPAVKDKIGSFTTLAANVGWRGLIEVDGSINPKTIPELVSSGADTLVGGSTGLFTGRSGYMDAVRELRHAAQLAKPEADDGSTRQ